MAWTDNDRQFYLGSLTSFLDRYCRDGQTEGTLSDTRIVQSYLSRLIYKLTCVMPELDHRSPNWTAVPEMPHPRKPIIAMGRVATENMARHNRCGLCEVSGRIYFWVDADNCVFDPTATQDWILWRIGSTGNDQQYCYDKPISPDILPDDALLEVMVALNARFEQKCRHGRQAAIQLQGVPAINAAQRSLWRREPSDEHVAQNHVPAQAGVKVPRG